MTLAENDDQPRFLYTIDTIHNLFQNGATVRKTFKAKIEKDAQYGLYEYDSIVQLIGQEAKMGQSHLVRTISGEELQSGNVDADSESNSMLTAFTTALLLIFVL